MIRGEISAHNIPGFSMPTNAPKELNLHEVRTQPLEWVMCGPD